MTPPALREWAGVILEFGLLVFLVTVAAGFFVASALEWWRTWRQP